jgi:Bacterial low temperature requirement A protein (LtrA)
VVGVDGLCLATNTLEPEEGEVRAGMFAAMAAMLVVALAVPEAFDADAVVFGVAYLIVRLLHLLLYAIAGKRDPDLLGAVLPSCRRPRSRPRSSSPPPSSTGLRRQRSE